MIKLLLTFICFFCFVFEAGEDHQDLKHSEKKTRNFNQRSPGEDPCLGGRGLAAFANGEDYNMPGMVALLTAEKCQPRYPQIARDALSQRISFFEEPFRLKQLALNYNPASLQSVEQASQTLQRVLPVVLKNHPMTNEAILPVLGQVAILSQVAARKVLAEMVQNELIASDSLMKSSSRDRGKLASDLAQTLLSLGGDSVFIAQEVAKATEELALSAQVDSLGKILSSLAEAARAEDLLISTLEQTVAAAKTGVEKGESFLTSQDRQKLLEVFFRNVKPPFFSEPEFEIVSASYDKALKTLLKNQDLNRTILKDAWRECLKVLSNNRQQKALSVALALSLTGELVYLADKDKQVLLMAANQYPNLAFAVQRAYLTAWNEAWDRLHEEKIPPSLFNARKNQYFIPFVEKILDMNPEYMDTEWVKFVWEKGFVREAQVGNRFPKMVLAHLRKREQVSQVLIENPSFEALAEGLAQNIAISRVLSSVHIPALKEWLKSSGSSDQ